MESNFDIIMDDENEYVVHLNITGHYMFKTDSKRVADSIIEALEKQIPRVVKDIPCMYGGEQSGICGKCGNDDLHTIHGMEYCFKCGQKLDWD